MSSRGFVFLFVAALISGAGCGDKYKDDDIYRSCSDGVERNFVDQPNDVSKKFIDLTELKVIIGEDCVGARIAVSELPSKLIFNHSALSEGELNYEWSVYFDMDDDGDFSEGDMALSVTQRKFEGSEEKEEDILSVTHDNLMEVDSNGEMRFLEHIHANISGNVFYLSASGAAREKLSGISASTKVKFQAAHNDGTEKYADVYPDSGLFE